MSLQYWTFVVFLFLIICSVLSTRTARVLASSGRLPCAAWTEGTKIAQGTEYDSPGLNISGREADKIKPPFYFKKDLIVIRLFQRE